jgi:VHL beta domain
MPCAIVGGINEPRKQPGMTALQPFLFVSHVSEDRPAAMQVVAELERRGVRCWIFSEHCNDSEYIRREVTVAGESQKVIIPFRVENVQPKRGLRVRLSDLHWIDAFTSREQAIDELVKTFDIPTHGAAADRPPGAQRPRAMGQSDAGANPQGDDAAELSSAAEPRLGSAAEVKQRAEEKVDSGPRRLAAGAERSRWRPALLLGALSSAAIIGAAGVWLALAPKSQSGVASGKPGLRCADEGQVKSMNSRQPAVVTFSNDHGSPVRMYWLDYSGQRKLYFTLKQGESRTESTFYTHPLDVHRRRRQMHRHLSAR